MDSYYQSGMNDILAKPFTKNGLFGILDKHLIHLKAIQLSGEVPRSVGVPPLSYQGVLDAISTSANALSTSGNMGIDWNGMDGMDAGDGQMELRNPLASMGWSDDTYQIILTVSTDWSLVAGEEWYADGRGQARCEPAYKSCQGCAARM